MIDASNVIQTNDFCKWQIQDIKVDALGGKPCAFELEEYDPEYPQEHIDAVNNFLKLSENDLKKCGDFLYQYYEDILKRYDPKDIDFQTIDNPSDVWKLVGFSDEITVSKRSKTQEIYISISGGCDWEEEHGLQIVFHQGKNLVKVGSFTGHLTNSDAYGDPKYENVIYVRI